MWIILRGIGRLIGRMVVSDGPMDTLESLFEEDGGRYLLASCPNSSLFTSATTVSISQASPASIPTLACNSSSKTGHGKHLGGTFAKCEHILEGSRQWWLGRDRQEERQGRCWDSRRTNKKLEMSEGGRKVGIKLRKESIGVSTLCLWRCARTVGMWKANGEMCMDMIYNEKMPKLGVQAQCPHFPHSPSFHAAQAFVGLH